MRPRNKLKPDWEEAKKFLSLIDPDAEEFTFQTFDDNANHTDRKNSSLSRIIIGSIDDPAVRKQLTDLLNQGAGVFVTVNETDGEGRTKENIIRIRVVWQEADHGDEPELPCEPHIVVGSSPGKFHRYVRTDTTTVDEFEPVQQRLVDDYGSDRCAKDRSRVMRLPGFFHQKGKPTMTRLLHCSGAAPTPWDEVKRIFPPVDRAGRQGSAAVETCWEDPVAGLPSPEEIMVCDFMRWFVSEPSRGTGRYHLARAFATNAYRTSGDSEEFVRQGLDANRPGGYRHTDNIIGGLSDSRPISCRYIYEGFKCPNFNEWTGTCRRSLSAKTPFGLAMAVKRGRNHG